MYICTLLFSIYSVIFSNWNDGRDHYAVMHDEVMIGTESAGSYCVCVWVGVCDTIHL